MNHKRTAKRVEDALEQTGMIIVGVLVLAGVLVTYLLAGDQQDGEEAGSKGNGEPTREESNITPPEGKTLRLTVPKMEHLKYDEIPTGTRTDEALFHDYAGVHIEHTGWPWEKEANLYIAGLRLGHLRTPAR